MKKLFNFALISIIQSNTVFFLKLNILEVAGMNDLYFTGKVYKYPRVDLGCFPYIPRSHLEIRGYATIFKYFRFIFYYEALLDCNLVMILFF